MDRPLDFQSIIMTLQHFWAERGCLIWQPYYTQVGAGTMNPATFLRVLGPEPWHVGYVEPSVRPDDGRYGENPNRLQQHTQFQVILKPDPGNPQEIYLQSLEALGIDPREHDIRFVEDNWESPALGAWGLGWEVWLDGQEITQFTYFQQAGGHPVDPVAVEITYGLERIAMVLQRVHNFRDIRWNEQVTYGDVHLAGEQEHSRYYFELADVDRLWKMYHLFEEEARAALDNGLVLPAHDYILKCSHTFNILDTRGAVGVTERQALFARMRDMARRVSEAYVAERQALEFPWLNDEAGESKSKAAAGSVKTLTKPAPFLLEIGVEELPVADLHAALEQVKTRLESLLDDLRLEHGAVNVYGTPRRLTAIVENLAPAQTPRTSVVKGPPASRAFDATGQATKAAEGFAASKGVALADLEVKEIDGGQYVVAMVKERSRPAGEVLSEALPGLIAAIRFDKVMRWNATNVAFSRPIRWLLALHGEELIPFEYADLISRCFTRGLRFRQPQEIEVHSLDAYQKALADQGILLDPARRKEIVSEQVLALMQKVGGSDHLDENLVDEVANLVEAPVAFCGDFDPQHLKLPAEVLVSVMKKHQRYFPVQDKNGKLLPYFIGVRNGDEEGLDVVTDGNEQVIRARFADAAFFIDEDVKLSLEEHLPRLGTLSFQQKLGSMLDKTKRVEGLAAGLAPFFDLTPVDLQTTLRAAHLCKADLVTHMVVEMTALQGIMGRAYALRSGEPEPVAQAIYEHYLPRFAGDALAVSRPGLVVGIADRLDSLVGLFAAGLAPSGTKDPFALRRAALGLVQSLMSWNIDFDLRQGMALAAARIPIPVGEEVLKACADFITGRLRSTLLEQGFRYDVVDAVLAAQANNPAGSARAIRELAAIVERPDWTTILPAYARCVRITRDQKEQFAVDEAALKDPADLSLYEAWKKAASEKRKPGSADDFLSVFQPMIPVINRYFEQVLVMAEDPALRNTRLGLLQKVSALAGGVADFSLLEGF